MVAVKQARPLVEFPAHAPACGPIAPMPQHHLGSLGQLVSMLLLVDQTGPACHTNRRSCFYAAVLGGEEAIIMEPEPQNPSI